MEHWKARMEFSGENHSQNAKGNRRCGSFFSNFMWSPGKHTGTSQGKIIIFRTLTPQREKEYNRIKRR